VSVHILLAQKVVSHFHAPLSTNCNILHILTFL